VIPLRDENPTKSLPIVVYLIIAINVAAYIYNGALGRSGNPLSGCQTVLTNSCSFAPMRGRMHLQ
jgi:hypothetical protein